jgi:hypothetical protein
LWVGVFGVTSDNSLKRMAGTTRLELATSAVTGQRSNQLNYVPNPEESFPDSIANYPNGRPVQRRLKLDEPLCSWLYPQANLPEKLHI